ncbi:N-acetylmuramoyl-L-alanine amidase [Streptomyces sp. H10-C2]|uniref:N-acetylmuramoyl-L-alanine amidase n=1 Tax=unclassified Streptomyces TaxID=2593676 RepID=UPI0024B8FBD8|nr:MULTISPECIES: N-acetylmuramoyl-L-alanine amidase [unclassified Streptomyces]MDJ0347010.1 N-acetylmuramoyl-L-alanine amidase [Streptomyces sp. PH10-H1]MDJ0372436.1 N-acetylmuramoyl-L-alanine amidase [Streptomyces sp. H10-C2]
MSAAVLVPTCFAGWLVYQSLHGPGGGDGSQRVLPLPSASAPRGNDSVDGKAAPSVPAASLTPSTASSGAQDPTSDPAKAAPAAPLPLRGKVVVIDPGHNTNNVNHTAEINRLVNIGTTSKECDTTGTSTNSGYAEASFSLDVSRRVRALLAERGARVRLTQDGDRTFGPCIDERARIGNEAHADAAVSVHGDGSAAGNRGFHVITPATVHAGAADTRPIVAPSGLLGLALKAHFASATDSQPSNYLADGTGLMARDDLGGLNLSTVPKAFIECGNMRDAQDAEKFTDPTWRQRAAEGIADGITAFLQGKR